MGLVSNVDVVMHIRFSTPPGTTPEGAVKLLSQGGVNIPLGLVQYVRKVDVEVLTSDPTQQGPKLT